MNMPYGGFDADFKIYKGTDGILEFYIKNLDRKPIPSQGKEYRINIIAYETNELVYTGLAEVVDPYKGLVVLSLSPTDTISWQAGIYRYTVTIINEDGTENPLYVKKKKNAVGYLEFDDTNLPVPAPTRTILASDFIPVSGATTCQIAESFPGSSNYSFYNNLITIAFYLTNYDGTVKVQASLDLTPQQISANWFDLDIVGDGTNEATFVATSGIEVYSVTGNYNWLRIQYCPDVANTGTLDQVLIKV